MIDFLGIGAQKCGTTWLYRNLMAHPAIEFPVGKEMHFWDRREGRDPADWITRFDGPPGRLRGEITPAYAFLDIPTIRDIRAACPEVRLFFSIRNPMARAWSSALMALDRAELEPEEASDQWFLDHFRSKGSLARGDYSRCLDNWLAVFPPDQLHLIWFDDIVHRPREVLVSLAGHIGADPRPFDELAEEELRRPAFEGRRLAIRPSLLSVLQSLYWPQIDDLGRRLSCDLSHWKAWPADAAA